MGADIPLNLLWALVKGPTIQYSFQHHFPRLALTLSSFVWNRKQPSLSFPYKLYSFRFFFFFSNLTCGRSSTPTVVWLTPKRTNLSPRAIIYEILFSRRVLISHQYQQQQQQVVQRALDSSLSLSLPFIHFVFLFLKRRRHLGLILLSFPKSCWWMNGLIRNVNIVHCEYPFWPLTLFLVLLL